MKEVTVITTIEVTDIERFTDEEYEASFGDIENARHVIESCHVSQYGEYADDVHAKVQFFVWDVDE